MSGSLVAVAVALASVGLLIANHARTGPASLLSRVWKRVWDDGKKQEDTPGGQRKKVLAAAEARKKKEVLLLLNTRICTRAICTA